MNNYQLTEHNFTWDIVELAEEPYYNQRSNIVRVKYKGALYDAMLSMSGARFKPRREVQRVLWVHPQDLVGKEVSRDVPVGNARVSSIAIIFDAAEFENYALTSGSSPKSLVDAPSSVPEGDEIVIHGKSSEPVERAGISVRRDGTILLKGKGIVLEASGGILMGGETVSLGSSSEKAGGLVQASKFSWLPSFVAFPNPRWWPDIGLLMQVASIVKAVASLRGKVIK
jgi:hypothetical protein